MTTYFVSDLHLTAEQPHIVRGFLSFLDSAAPRADAIYVLGDLFEYWIGDDAASLLQADPILDAMRTAADQTPCFFIAGNRDFLVREGFSKQSGFTVLADHSTVDLYGTKTLLLHGDSLCTDDIAHQQFRAEMVNNSQWCDHFLGLPIPQRIELAKMARAQSQTQHPMTNKEIMDVTDSAVLDAFARHNVNHMIHGHTHRQNTHHYSSQDGARLTRTVLGDWGKTNSILKVTRESMEFENAALQ